MSKKEDSILNLKHLLPENLKDKYITQEEIEKDHPLHENSNKGAGDTYTLATVLVSERHAKYDLVDLVNHLLQKIENPFDVKSDNEICYNCQAKLCEEGYCHNKECSKYRSSNRCFCTASS